MNVRDRLQAGESVVGALVIGDSIARGDEASTPAFSFMGLWADELHDRYGCRVVVTNLSMGGATARTARRMLNQVIALSDYGTLIVAVGVNDAAEGVPIKAFTRSLRKMAQRADRLGTETTFITPPQTRNDTAPYAEAIRGLGRPYVDVHAASADIVFANGINHPDDAGHQMYARLLLEATTDGISAERRRRRTASTSVAPYR